MGVRVKFEGPLFVTGSVKSAIEAATRETLRFGQSTIAAATPIDTGRLQASWENDDAQTIYSEVEYAPYVEEGTTHMTGRFMAQNSMPAINEFHENAVNRNLENLK